MKAKKFEQQFDEDVDITASLDLSKAKRVLQDTGDLLEASYQSGLSGPGRLPDLIVNVAAVTPGEYKRKGAGLVISWGVHASPFGEYRWGPVRKRILLAAELAQGQA